MSIAPRLTTALITALISGWLGLAPPAALDSAGGGGGAGTAAAQDVLRIAAVVNDEVISERDLAERLRLVAVTSGLPPTPENQRRLLPQVLRGLIQETLQLQEARRLNIAVTDEELERAFATIAQQNNMPPEQLRQVLEASGVSADTLRRQLEAQLAWLKVIGREIRPRVTVTEARVEQALRERAGAPGQPEYLLAEILLPVDDPSQEEAAAQDARRLVEALRGGAGFEALARQFSAAGTAARGGDLGWVPAAALPPELLGVVDQLAAGEVSPPLRSNLGYHLFLLRDRRTAANPTAAATAAATDAGSEVALAQVLFPAPADADAATIEALRAEAAALRPRLDGCEAVARVAEEIGAPSSGMLGAVRVGDLPPELGRVVRALPVGEVSQPLRGPGGIHLLMVCARGEEAGDQEADGGGAATAVSAAERQEVVERLEQEQLQRLARRYLRNLRKDAFVDVRLGEPRGGGAGGGGASGGDGGDPEGDLADMGL